MTLRWPRLAAFLALVLAPALAGAHEIPNEVTVHAFLKPDGTRLVLLVRAPLGAMRDMDVPVKGPGFLDLARIDPVLRDAATLWIGDYVQVFEGDTPLGKPEVLAARVSLPSDRSFESYDQALAHITGPGMPLDTELYWQQGLLDVAFTYPIASERSEFSIEPGLTRLGLRVNVVLRVLMPDGRERLFDLHGETGVVKLDPRWHQAALRFALEGFFHILDGIDHLLFLLCLVIPFRVGLRTPQVGQNLRALIVVVTAFTLAHSITLVASAYDVVPEALWFPPLVETLIALSIVYMAFENIVAPRLERRWLITFAFGLVHGFGFSFALRETLQLAGSHVLTSLLSFNVGVELGQLLVLVVLVPVLDLAFRYVVSERMGTIILSAIVAHTGWHWMVERGGALLHYTIAWPVLDAAFFAALLRFAMVLAIGVFAAWLLSLFSRGAGVRAGSPYPPAAAPRSEAASRPPDGETPGATRAAPAAETRSA